MVWTRSLFMRTQKTLKVTQFMRHPGPDPGSRLNQPTWMPSRIEIRVISPA